MMRKKEKKGMMKPLLVLMSLAIIVPLFLILSAGVASAETLSCVRSTGAGGGTLTASADCGSCGGADTSCYTDCQNTETVRLRFMGNCINQCVMGCTERSTCCSRWYCGSHGIGEWSSGWTMPTQTCADSYGHTYCKNYYAIARIFHNGVCMSGSCQDSPVEQIVQFCGGNEICANVNGIGTCINPSIYPSYPHSVATWSAAPPTVFPVSAASYGGLATSPSRYEYMNYRSVTIAAWIKTSSSGLRPILSAYGTANPNTPPAPFSTIGGYKLFLENGQLKGSINDVGKYIEGGVVKTTTMPVVATAAVNNNRWHHVAMAYDGLSYVILYVDGVEKARLRNDWGILWTQESLRVGSSDTDIKMDQIKLYDYALAPLAISGLAATAPCADADNDGYSPEGTTLCGTGALKDCDDTKANIKGATDGSCNGDGDDNQYIDISAYIGDTTGSDCNDNNNVVFPGQLDTSCDNTDTNCNVKKDEDSYLYNRPRTTATYTLNNTWTNQDASFALNGVSECQYVPLGRTEYCSSSTAGCTNFASGTSVSITTSGIYYVNYRSVSKYDTYMLNPEAINTIIVKIDKTLPVSWMLPPFILPAYTTTGSVPLTWAPTTDALSGIANYEVWKKLSAAPNYPAQSQSGLLSNQTTSFTDENNLADGSTYSYKIRAYDKAGNYVDSIERTTTIDKLSPTVNIINPTANQITNNNTVVLKANYNNHELVNCIARLDSGANIDMTGDNQINGTANYSFSGVSDGFHSFNVTCSDAAGNRQSAIRDNIRVDTAAPLTTSSFTSTDWQTSYISITLSCNNLSGSACANTYYWIYPTDTGIPSTSTAITPIPLQTFEGIKYIRFRSVDAAGNTETIRSQILKIDKTKPVTNGTVSGTLYFDGYYGPVNVSLSGIDAVSGIKETKYCIGTSCSPTTIYSTPFAVSSFGSNDIRYFSTDNATNIGVSQTSTIKIHGCGDNVIDSGKETCEGSNFGGKNCTMMNGTWYTGSLICTSCQIDTSGCTFSPPDSDGDGFNDNIDNCVNLFNHDQNDSDGDGLGTACDNCWLVSNPTQTDSDNDCLKFRASPASPFITDPTCGNACCMDSDGDKYQGASPTCARGTDCNDANAKINPGIIESSFYNAGGSINITLCVDNKDNNCNNKCDVNGCGAITGGDSGCRIGMPDACTIPDADGSGIVEQRDFNLFALVNSSSANNKLYQQMDVAYCKNIIIENTTA